MNTTALLHFYDYNYWANAAVLKNALQLAPAELARSVGASHGSVFSTLLHAYGAEWMWGRRVRDGVSPTRFPGATDLPHLIDLVRAWVIEEKAMRAYLKGLPSEELSKVTEYRNTEGRIYQTPLLQVLLHVVNHGTQHRAEAAAELTRMDKSPGEFDYMVYIRRNEKFDFDRSWIEPLT